MPPAPVRARALLRGRDGLRRDHGGRALGHPRVGLRPAPGGRPSLRAEAVQVARVCVRHRARGAVRVRRARPDGRVPLLLPESPSVHGHPPRRRHARSLRGRRLRRRVAQRPVLGPLPRVVGSEARAGDAHRVLRGHEGEPRAGGAASGPPPFPPRGGRVRVGGGGPRRGGARGRVRAERQRRCAETRPSSTTTSSGGRCGRASGSTRASSGRPRGAHVGKVREGGGAVGRGREATSPSFGAESTPDGTTS